MADTKQDFKKLLETRMGELVEKGTLVAIGADKLYAQIKDEFAEQLKKAKCRFSKKKFAEKLDSIVWTPKRLRFLEEVVEHDLPLETFTESYPFIPKSMAAKKAAWLVGVSSPKDGPASFIPGMGRLDLHTIDQKELARFRFPSATFKDPFCVPIHGTRWNVPIINGTNVGIVYSRLIKDNVVRRAFSEARYRGAPALILTNFIDIDVTKAAGPNKVYRALVSGLRTKPEMFDDESYQKEAKRILDAQKLAPKDLELVYVTFAEKFAAVMEAWQKITHRPIDEKNPGAGEEPEFPGPVVAILGYKEELLICAVAYAEARYATIQKQNALRVKIKIAASELTKARKNDDFAAIGYWAKEHRRMGRELAKVIITGVADDLFRQVFYKTRAFVAMKIEAAIPNCKVVGVGSSCIQLGSEKINIHIPDSINPTYSLLANYVRSYGVKVLRKEMAPTTVICHPHALYYDETARECDESGERGSVRVYVAPIAVDDTLTRDRLKRTVRHIHQISKIAFNEQFRPGVCMLDFNNSMVNCYPIPIANLGAGEERQKKESTKKQSVEPVHVPLMDDPLLKYVYLLTITDPHYGSRNREGIWSEERQQFLGVDEAFFWLLRRSGLCYTSDFPFHMSAMNDDPVQGNHFQVQQQPHPHELPLWVIEEHWRIMRKKIAEARNNDDIANIVRESQRFNLRQFALRPPDWYQNQLQLLCHKRIDENIDVFGSIVNKAMSSGLIFKGMSHFEGTPGDGRDLGAVNEGSGNHGIKTVNRELTEGWICAERIKLRLLGDSNQKMWQGKEDKLNQLVKAPLYSNRFFAWGTMQAPGGYEYAFDLRDTPPRMKGWNDPLAGWIAVDPSRGNVQRFAEGKFLVHTCGDKHFHALAILPYALYLMGGPGTHTDLFGEFGFPPNNTGISILGLPKDGPDSGPTIVRYFPFERLKFHIEHPEIPFDWKAYLPNPA